MEKNKLEISGRISPETQSASYKPIPEKDMEEQALSSARPKSIFKSSGGSEVDGADEKMLSASVRDDDKVPEVVIFNNDAKSPQNGDAKLEIAEGKQAFVGLTKEELMKYANDPFWVRLRWFLFISFWLLWAAMLVGAILIIYAAPKCDPPPPRTWYQQGPIAELPPNTPIDNLKLDKNIQGLIISWTADAYQPLKNNPDGLALIETTKKDYVNVVLEVDPTVSTLWFEQSEKRSPEFDGYYIWRPGSIKGTDTNMSAPNNWVSPKNVSSWKYSETRKEYYYAPFERPHLNFRNQSVINEFSKVIDQFLSLNISGIRLRNAPFLLVDSSFENEEPDTNASPGLSLTQYGFYKHSKTEDLIELGPLLNGWKNLVRNKTVDGPFMVAEELAKVESYKVNGTLVVDMPLQRRIFSKPVLTVDEIGNSLNYTFNINRIEWPLWEAKSNALPQDVLDIITYLLPGAPLVNTTEKVNSELLKIRESPSIMRGICGVYGLQNNTIFAFIRVAPGSPGILVAVNPTANLASANLPAEIPPLANLQEVTIRYYSQNYNVTDFQDIGGKRNAASVPVSPKSAIVLEYVPKKEE